MINLIKKTEYLLQYKQILLPLFCAYCISYSQTDSVHEAIDSCSPRVTFFYGKVSQTFCLNRFVPGPDSCAEIEISYDRTHGIKAIFKCDNQHNWLLDTVIYNDQSSSQQLRVKAGISVDQSGYLKEMQLFMAESFDTSKINLGIKKITDIPMILKDSSQLSLFTIKKAVFLCPIQRHAKLVIREYTYPAWYMKREPVYNYPELKMFHYGGSVKIPFSGSIREVGELIVVWHVLHPPKFKYEESKREIREEKPKVKKKRFLKFRPID